MNELSCVFVAEKIETFYVFLNIAKRAHEFLQFSDGNKNTPT